MEPAFEALTFPTIDDWAKARRQWIGSSEAGALWGVSSYASPRSVYEQKIYGVEPDIDPDLAAWGHEVEPAIANFYAKKTGYRVIDPGANVVYRSKRWPWIAASLDRVIEFHDTQELGSLECKNRGGGGARTWAEDGDGAPLDVQLQVQQVLAVTGWRRTVIGVALGGLPPLFIDVERDDELIEMHVEKCRAFWFEHIEARKPPPVDGSDATHEALRRRFAAFQSGKIVTLDKEALTWHRRLERVKQTEKALKEHKQLLESRMREVIGDAEVALLPGGGALKMTRIKECTFTTNRKAYVRMDFKEKFNTFKNGA